jgi:arylsulfatase A-like enzyme
MFTSRWPHELSARIDAPLDERYPTIAEHLAAQGYATAGFIANTYFCNAWFGLGRGFAHYDDMALTPATILRTSHLGRRLLRSVGTRQHERPTSHFSRKDAATINGEFLSWLDHRPNAARPFFVFINYFDAHDPYLMPRPEGRPFGRVARTQAEIEMLRNWNLLDGKKLTADQLALARDCYDDCLAQLDREVGRMLGALEARGILESTWIVITSDHGEQFGEHGFIGHGNSVHRQTVHVPLLVVPPKSGPAVPASIKPPVSLRDLPATLVDLTGTKPPSPPFEGGSLSRFWSENASPESVADPYVFSEIVDHEGPVGPDWQMPKALISDGYSFIRQCDGREELFHILSDPDETTNLIGSADHGDRVARFRAWLGELER